MKQNEFMVGLINKKEKIHELYANKERVLKPLLRGILTFIILWLTIQMFPYDSKLNHVPILLTLAVIQAFLPLSALYFFSTALILANLWEAGFDIFLGFLVFVCICLISYVRVNYRYMYIAAIIPILFWGEIGMAAPALAAIAIGLEALIPSVIGVLVYYFSLALQAAFASMSADQPKTLGIALKALAVSLGKERTMFVTLFAVTMTIIVTTLLRKLFSERAWLISAALGNAFMAVILMMGSLYLDMKVKVPMILLQMILGIILSLLYEFFRGIGDVSRVEKTVFEDDEYIYYVKAVPKIRVAQKDLNVKVVNESFQEQKEEAEESSRMSEEANLPELAEADSPAEVCEAEEADSQKEIYEAEETDSQEEIYKAEEADSPAEVCEAKETNSQKFTEIDGEKEIIEEPVM